MTDVSYSERKDPTMTPSSRFNVSIHGEDGEGIDTALVAVGKLETKGSLSFNLRVNRRGFDVDAEFDNRETAVKVFKSLGGK